MLYISDGLALVGKALARPGSTTLYQYEQWIIFAGVCKPVLSMPCPNSRQVQAYGCWGHSLLVQCSGKIGCCVVVEGGHVSCRNNETLEPCVVSLSCGPGK